MLEQEGDSVWEKSGDMLSSRNGDFLFAFSWSVSEAALFGESARKAKCPGRDSGRAGTFSAWATVVAISHKQ